MYSFQTQLAKGSIAEHAAYTALTNKHGIDLIQDVRKHPTYQEKGIDFIAPDGTYEIKSDSFNTQMVFIETIRHVEWNRPGWLKTCEADYIIWVKPKATYTINWPSTREVILQQVDQYTVKTTKTRVNDETSYSTQGILVPVSHLRLVQQDNFWGT